MTSKKSKGTPTELDYLFEREIITERDYADFWSRYWKAKKANDRQAEKDLIAEFTGKEEKPKPKPERKPRHFSLTKNRKAAERTAKKVGGYTVRRNRFGQFSKRGQTFQVIMRKKIKH